jgi:hypothetical protein
MRKPIVLDPYVQCNRRASQGNCIWQCSRDFLIANYFLHLQYSRIGIRGYGFRADAVALAGVLSGSQRARLSHKWVSGTRLSHPRCTQTRAAPPASWKVRSCHPRP